MDTLNPNEDHTTVGKTITIKGEVTGNEPLTIQGKVEGRISLDNSIVVKQSGVVKADISSHSITVEGSVYGNIDASDKFEIVKGGLMVGDIKAPRVVINDGAVVKGQVDMEVSEDNLGSDSSSSSSASRPSTSDS